jgi:hypothetical protein
MDETRHDHGARVGHETTDVNVWAVGKFGVALVVVCVMSIALLWGLLKYFQSEQATSMATTVEPTKLFPQPRLQRTPVLDLRAIRAEEDKVLDSYAWVDQKQGVVRIPVALAIDVLAKRGLPAVAPASAKEAAKK